MIAFVMLIFYIWQFVLELASVVCLNLMSVLICFYVVRQSWWITWIEAGHSKKWSKRKWNIAVWVSGSFSLNCCNPSAYYKYIINFIIVIIIIIIIIMIITIVVKTIQYWIVSYVKMYSCKDITVLCLVVSANVSA